MEGESAVLDVEVQAEPSVESEQPSQQQPDAEAVRRQEDKAYSDWIKGLKEDGDAAKFHRRAKDDFGRLQELRRIDPKGLDGVRSTYDSIKGIAHGDKAGMDAVTAMRDALAENQTAMDALANGDFDSLSEDTRSGVIRMTPALLDTLAESNPDAYSAALLPHFLDALKASDLVANFNSLADALSQKPPSWLTKEQIPSWTNERLTNVLQYAKGMADWFTAQEKRLTDMGGKHPETRTGGESTRQESTQQTGTANPQYWAEKIHPQSNQYAEESFNRELAPWEKKLAEKGFRLSKLEKSALMQSFVGGVSKAAGQSQEYRNQMGRYNRMKSPDAGAVMSVFRSEFNRHASNVMKSLVEENWGDKLKAGKPGPKPGQTQQRQNSPAAPEKGVRYGSMKPRKEDIDNIRTPKEWIYDDKRYRRILKDGSTFELRP